MAQHFHNVLIRSCNLSLQLGKLETTVKEHKSVTEKRNIELQSEVKKAKIELKERNSQVCPILHPSYCILSGVATADIDPDGDLAEL